MMNNVMLDALQSRHTTLEGLTVLVVTWNVNAKLEEAANLRKLIFPEEEKCFGSTPDIIVFGLQEMIELSTSNVIGAAMVGNGTDRVDQWKKMILQVLKEKDKSFEAVTANNMVGLCITVFSLRAFKQHVSKIQVSSIGRGVGGVLGNKGAVYARFNIKDTSICFVCAHFAAHREHLLKRNEDFHAILYHKAFPGLLDNAGTSDCMNLSQHNAAHMAAEAAKVGRMQERIHAMKKALNASHIPVSPPMNVRKEQLANYTRAADHDIIIWLGDLNYRLLGGMENSRIYDMIDGRRSFALLGVEQLNIEKEKGTVFQGFHEGLITFDPTYKYSPGTPNYNRERCPAWCDRVLWKLRKADLDMVGFLELDNYVCDNHFASPKGSPEVQAPSSDADVEVRVQGQSQAQEDEVSADAAVADSALSMEHVELVEVAPALATSSDGTDNSAGQPEQAGATANNSAVIDALSSAADEAVMPDVEAVSSESASENLVTPEPVSAVFSTSSESISDAAATAAGVLQLDVPAADLTTDDAQNSDTSSDQEEAPRSARPGSALTPAMQRPLSQIVPESRVTEIVELMVYNRGENIISDHKPVRALMSVKFKRVDWAAHERHLVRHYTHRCQHRPQHTLSHTMIHGAAPVVFAPRVVTLFCTAEGNQQVLEVSNNTVNTVRYQLAQELPRWLSVSPAEGVLGAGQKVLLQVNCDRAVAESSIIESLGLDATHADDQLREVWRRHTRNPDERGNPQLTALLQLLLFTHAVSHVSSGSSGSYAGGTHRSYRHGEDRSGLISAAGVAAGTPVLTAVSCGCDAVDSAESDQVTAADENSGSAALSTAETAEPAISADADVNVSVEVGADQTAAAVESQSIEKCEAVPMEDLCVALSPLLIPVVCKISP